MARNHDRHAGMLYHATAAYTLMYDAITLFLALFFSQSPLCQSHILLVNNACTAHLFPLESVDGQKHALSPHECSGVRAQVALP